MGGGKKKSAPAPIFMPPPPDNTFNQFLQAEQAKEQEAANRAENERKVAADKETARKASGAAGFGGFRSNLESQLRQGLITYNDASTQLRDYGGKYEVNAEDAVNTLSDVYTKELLPGRRATGIEAAYEEMLQRPGTEKEKKTATTRFEQGYYTSIQDLKDSLAKGPEYQDKFQTSYLGNYYDTMYGKEERDTEGKRTGKRAFTFDGGSINGTPGEIEEQVQKIRDNRKYLHSAGLTTLQGDIDKETQKLKNEGAKDVAKIGAAGDIYKSLVGSFSF